MLKNFFFLLVLVITVSSCIPNEKVLYIQNKEDLEELGLDQLITPPREEYELQPRDIISITFYSRAKEAVTPFEQVTNDILVQSGQKIAGPTFLIDNLGYLNVNTLEPILAKGLTTVQLQTLLENKIEKVIGVKDIDVNVSLAGIRYTTMGYMGSGQHVIAGSEANILEAIANAGELSTQADRQHVQIIRTYPDGLKIHEVDVTDRTLLQSQFFYIKPGDIIYAPPLKIREVGTGDNFTAQLGTVVSILTSFLFIVSVLKN